MPDEERFKKQAAENARLARARANAGNSYKQRANRPDFDWDKAIRLFKRTLRKVYR